MNKVKTITLSIEEVTAIFAITDETLRNRAIDAINKAAENPGAVNMDDYLDGDPLILELVWRIVRKAEQARQRRERRVNPAERKPKGMKSSAKPLTIEVEMTEANVRRLLWIKQHFVETVDQVTRALAMHAGDWLGEDISASFAEISANVSRYLKPVIDIAAGYYRLPRHMRPRTVSLPVSPMA